MKEIKMFILERCPHCKKVKQIIVSLLEEHPEYKEIPFSQIDEKKEPEIANRYDYYYVPTLFVGEEKMMEGVPNVESIEKVFEKALRG